MKNTKKVLITGVGVHVQRYTETLLFCRKYSFDIYIYADGNDEQLKQLVNYDICFVNETSARELLKKIDLLIISNLPGKKKAVFRWIKLNGYHGNVIIEKPFALSYENYIYKKSIVENNNYLIAYSRQFYKKEIEAFVAKQYELTEDKEILVRWPNFKFLGIDMMKDTLPHVLDFLLCVDEESLIYVVENYSGEKKSLYLRSVNHKTRVINVEVYESKDIHECVTINNQRIEYPNYYDYILKMVDVLLDDMNISWIEMNHKIDGKITAKLYEIYEKTFRRDSNE